MLTSKEGRRTAYRSVRYSTGRKDTLTADLNSLPKFRIKIKSHLDSTCFKSDAFETRMAETLPFYNEKQTYMQTFKSLIHTSRLGEQQKKEWSKMEGKVLLPNFDHQFQKPEGTEFTLLDQFHKPYSHIQKMLAKGQQQLSDQRDDLKLLKFQLEHLKNNVENSLKSSEEQGLKAIAKLRSALRKNETSENERKLRVKRQIRKLEHGDAQNRQSFNKTHKASLELQTVIFSCHPFELQLAQRESAQILYF